MYAGADGNVYKKTDSGWDKYDNGSWNSVNKPATQRTSGQANTMGSTQSRGGSEGMSQLEQDRTARMTGGARQQQFESMRGGGGFAGRGGGGFRR